VERQLIACCSRRRDEYDPLRRRQPLDEDTGTRSPKTDKSWRPTASGFREEFSPLSNRKQKTMNRPYVLPNRKAFADYIARIFLKYRQDDRDNEGAPPSSTRELFPYQKLVRDYLQIETPYRGLLLYHGLGSGKTCSSIGVAESLLSERKVVVMLPASLQSSYRAELRKCGDPIYILNNHWRVQVIRSEADKVAPKSLGIPDEFLAKQGRYFITIPGAEPNYKTLPLDIQKGIDEQVSAIIDSRYTFINYNGLNSENIRKIIPDEDPSTSHVFDDHVIIVDEIHNLISRIVNASDIGRRLYDALMNAKNCKIVGLSGTPVINRPNEISYLMNLLRGPIEQISIPMKAMDKWDEPGMTTFFRKIPEVDSVEFNSIKRIIMVTRNPEHFKSVYNEKGERVAVQYNKEGVALEPEAWVKSFRDRFVTEFKGEMGEITVQNLTALPTDLKEFASMFLDGLKIKNPLLFQRRIQGLVSYFKGADEKLLPKRVDDDKVLEKVEMSEEQFTRYLEVRWQEIQRESKKAQKGPEALDENFSSYRVMSRLICDYMIPKDIRGTSEDSKEDEQIPKPEILQKLKDNPDRFLSEGALNVFSPKFKKALKNIKESVGTSEAGFRNQFVYSQYRELEGLGVFSAILSANGFQEYKLVKQDGKYVEDPSLDPNVPAYCFYTGKEDAEVREIMRFIFNEEWSGIAAQYAQHAQSIKDSIQKRGGKKLLCVILGSASAAEGLNLRNVRHIHILEPYWNPARHDQVIGRGIRIGSHLKRERLDGTLEDVPESERTIRISFYMSVFSKDQESATEYPNIVPIRRADSIPKRYDRPDTEVKPPEAFMSSDEFLYEIAFEKERIAKGIALLLKQAAVDCEVHRKLHSREQPVIQCLRFDSTVGPEDIAAKNSYKSDYPDETYLRNLMKRARRLQKIKIKDIVFLVDKDSKEVFDLPSYEEDNKRLLRIGLLRQDRIQFFTYV
jgi:hypothetical protein